MAGRPAGSFAGARILPAVLVVAIATAAAIYGVLSPAPAAPPDTPVELHRAVSLPGVQQLIEQQGGRPPGAPLLDSSQTDLQSLQSRSIPPPPALPASFSEASSSTTNDLCQQDSKTQSYCIYVVQAGETLSGIAQAFGLSSTPAFTAGELLAWSNGMHLSEASTIQPGQELRVPLATGVIHTVSASEVLTSLAQQYGVSVEAIASANNISDPDSVGAGKDLLIPEPGSVPNIKSASVEDEDDRVADAVNTDSETKDEDGGSRDEAPVRTANNESPGNAQATTTREAPLAAPSPSSRQASAPNAVAEAFAAGFRSVGGSESILDHLLQKVIPCESGYNVRALNPIGPYYGLLQFLPSAWQAYGGGDWTDPWQQGANAARMLKAREARAQWPGCW